ncbi:MAG: hypothetical protein U0103_14095 [Candidatus Obscuribacterales bacterium]|nr:hypothetical protein [Cyanobacteria bacterium SZAS LIN-5]
MDKAHLQRASVTAPSHISKLKIKMIVALVTVSLLGSAISAAAREPNYVIFSFQTSGGFAPPGKNIGEPTEDVWDAEERRLVEQLRQEFGEQRPGQQRHIGFSVDLTPTLNVRPEQLKTEVKLALDLAELNSIPVLFHLDDQHFWWQSPELCRSPDMVEWSDFPKKGQAHGPVVPKYWLNWGTPVAVYPAPPPCFACGAFREALGKRLEIVASLIVPRLSAWRKQGKEYLLAGVVAGNETQVPDFSHGYPGYTGVGEAVGVNKAQNPPPVVRMSPGEMVPIGYHSLYAMGYNWDSLQRLARAQNKSLDQTVKQLFDKVAHDYAEFQAQTLNADGLPKSLIYTHFTSANHSVNESANAPPSAGRPGSSNLAPPISSAINAYSRPGFTVVHDGVDLDALEAQLKNAHAPEDGRAWAVVESYISTGQPGVPQMQQQYEEYLGGLFSHGAKLVNVLGWNIPTGEPFAVRGSAAVPVVKKWLAGANLPPTWHRSRAAEETKESMQAEFKALQKVAADAVARGCDPRQVQALIDSFNKECTPLAKTGHLPEARAIIERTIARLRAL